jgi:hypothetical protein
MHFDTNHLNQSNMFSQPFEQEKFARHAEFPNATSEFRRKLAPTGR